MATNFVNDGKVITYANTGSAISSGDVVVVGQQLGIALVDIAATTGTGSVALSGVYSVPKVSAAVIAQGESVIYDVSASAFDDNAATPATGDVSGCCVAMEAAGNGVTTVNVKLNVGVGTVA
jgi:predicted RecA/RadA family phage recombinase